MSSFMMKPPDDHSEETEPPSRATNPATSLWRSSNPILSEEHPPSGRLHSLGSADAVDCFCLFVPIRPVVSGKDEVGF